jgi:hypothetical protein
VVRQGTGTKWKRVSCSHISHCVLIDVGIHSGPRFWVHKSADSTFLILPATTIFEISIIVSVRSDLSVVSHCRLYDSGISKAGAACRPSVVSQDKLQLAFCRIFRRWASNVAFEYHEMKFKLPILYHYAKG